MDTHAEDLNLRKQALEPIQTPREGNAAGKEMMEGQPWSPIARSFHNPDSSVYIITMFGLKSQVNPDVFKANLVLTLLKHPRFSSLQVVDEEGEMRWVQTEVDIKEHVVVPESNPNINMDSPDKFVEDYVADLSKKAIDMSKPLWDIHLLNVRTSEAEAVAILRVHHSLGDGTSLMSLLQACTRKASNRKASDPKALPTFPKITKSNSSKQFWLRSVFQLLWNTMIDVLMFLATALFLNDTKTPLKALSGVGSSTPRRILHRTVSLDDVKLVKNAMNTTINDVMLGVTQAGLSRYLNRRYGEGKKDEGATEKENNLPKNIRLTSVLFINLRQSAGIHALADMIEKGTKAKWGNDIGYVLCPLTIALCDNPLDYVRKAKAVMDRKKASLEATYTFSIAKLMLKFFGKVVGFPSHPTMWYSNVVGPQEEIGLFGYPVAYIAPSCYGQPSGFMIHAVSYANKMTLILSIADGLVPDPHQLCDDLEESLKLIKDAVIAGGSSS